jgi:alpha-glucosidase
MLLLTLRGTPFIYYGEEIGMSDVPVPPERVVDVHGRDPERTPMQWDATPNAGFTAGDPWLPVAADASRVNVAAQRGDPHSIFSFYRRLTRVRRASPALRMGRYRTLPSARGVYAFERQADGERVIVALNFASSERSVTLPSAGSELLLSTDDSRSTLPGGTRLDLAPDEGVILRTR